jgi:hypothetical protein
MIEDQIDWLFQSLVLVSIVLSFHDNTSRSSFIEIEQPNNNNNNNTNNTNITNNGLYQIIEGQITIIGIHSSLLRHTILVNHDSAQSLEMHFKRVDSNEMDEWN